MILPNSWVPKNLSTQHLVFKKGVVMFYPCSLCPSDNVRRSRHADEPQCAHFSTVTTPSWISQQISVEKWAQHVRSAKQYSKMSLGQNKHGKGTSQHRHRRTCQYSYHHRCPPPQWRTLPLSWFLCLTRTRVWRPPGRGGPAGLGAKRRGGGEGRRKGAKVRGGKVPYGKV